jgi:amidase
MFLSCKDKREADMRTSVLLKGVAALVLTACQPAAKPAMPAADDFSTLVSEPRTIAQLAADMQAGTLTSEKLTQSYIDRIAAVDDAGPMLNAILSINPNAIANAQALDQMRAGGVVRGPLHGVAIIVKDNIDTLDPMPTTAGSLALQDNLANRDAPVVARLRDAGAVIIGKSNLSEWANFRGNNSVSGWSAVGGLTKNPYVLDRSACGSSSGSGAAVAAGLAAAAVGTETDGSISCPSAASGLVGIKPTVGLIPRTHIVPISSTQDTAGPMALTVSDAALLLTIMAGSDASDPATAQADFYKADYTRALDKDALKGKRIGVARFMAGYHVPTDAAFETALAQLKAAGAELVEIKDFPNQREIGAAEGVVLKAEFHAGLDDYLASTPATVKVRSLADLVAFNKAAPAELEFFGQEILEESLAAPALQDAKYLEARATGQRLAGKEGIDKVLTDNKLDALVAPTGGPAWTTDLVTGDHFLGASSTLPSVAGYPYITVPMGEVRDLPVGLSFIGTAWSEARLIAMAYAFEQLTQARQAPAFLPHSP